jgi:fructose-1,6-bisphosphatase/inositol monophosphatase family enzyme
MNAQLPMQVTAPFSIAQRSALFNLVRRAAQTEIMPRFRRLDQTDIARKTSALDLVTVADRSAEAMIARGLKMAFPSAVIVGEENCPDLDAATAALAEAELGFLIDPVDGTWNFAHGLPLFGTMLAATRFGRPVFAAIYDPICDDLLWADNQTPSKRRNRLGISHEVRTREGSVLSDLVGYADINMLPASQKARASTAMQALAHCTTLRCSAHHYKLLAEGAVDFVLATRLNPWDHAPGVLLCQQAGGHSAMLDGTPYSTDRTSGFILSAGSARTWELLAGHFASIAED